MQPTLGLKQCGLSPPPDHQAGGLEWNGRISMDRNKQKLEGSVGHLSVHLSPILQLSPVHLLTYPACSYIPIR